MRTTPSSQPTPTKTPDKPKLWAQPPGGLEILLANLVLWAGILVVIWMAARVFRVGVLMYGKPPSFKEVFRWLREA